MYRCQITGKQTRQGEPLNKIVVGTRARTYKHWDAENEEEWFTHGTEIVKEINVCAEGLAMWNTWTEEERKLFVLRNYPELEKQGS